MLHLVVQCEQWCSVNKTALTVGRVLDCRAQPWLGAGDRRGTDEYSA